MKASLLSFFTFFVAFNALAQNSVTVYSAESRRPSQSGADIFKCLDGDINTTYHSKWEVSAMPDTIDFTFYNVKSINEIKYTPRQTGTNGVWQSIEVYHTTVDEPTSFIKDHTITNWGLNNAVKTINYAGIGIVKPFIIRFIVKAAGGNFSSCAEMNFYSSETGNSIPAAECDLSTTSASALKDTKIVPSSATASPSSSEGAISKSYDNDFSTIYHTRYGTNKFVVSAVNPALLTYSFALATSMDYLVYHPRKDGSSNGNFGEIEVQYRKTGDAANAFTTIVDYNAEFKSSPSLINFPSTLTNVIQIRVRVKSGDGEFASCSEMEFYKTNNFDNAVTGGVFKNNLYSELNQGTTQAQINSISSDFFKAMANCIFNNTYNYRYRVQQYEPYKIVSNLAATLKTSTYSSLENPTGIYFEAGTEAVIFVGPEVANNSISLQVADMRVHNAYLRSSYALKPGVNVVNIANAGLGYIDYYTDNTTAQPVTIHIASGSINGCFDGTKDSSHDWISIVNSSTYPQIDIKGKYMNLLFDRALLKKYNPLNVKPLADTYDTIAKIQFNMMGLAKYNMQPRNHMFAYGHNTGGLYAGGLGMHFDYSWGESNYVSVNGVLNKDIWGVAHEIGHINQLRPTFRWIGMTEVTNNIYSTYTQYTLGPTQYVNARLERENANPYEGDAALLPTATAVIGGRYKGFFDRAFVRKDNYMYNNVFGRVVPLWQMQLYYQFAGALKGAPTLEQRMSGVAPAPAAGQADYAYWLGDLMQIQRGRSDAGLTDGELMLNFVKDVCDVVKEDLTGYFVAIGMLKPINIDIEDYSTRNYTVTEAQITQTIASIKAKNYPLPVSPVLYYLSANSLNAFKNKLLAQGTYKVGATLSGTTLTVDHNSWKNVVAYETYKNDNNVTLLEITVAGMGSENSTQTTITYPANADYVWAVSYDGSKKLVYSRTTPPSVLPVKLNSFGAKLVPNGVELKWSTSSEKNNKKFELHRSANGVDFTKITEIAGNGTKETSTKYQYLDKDFKQSAYYKLVQIDFDGIATAYDDEVRFVKGLDDAQEVIVYPSPTTNKINIKGISSPATINVIDVMGRTVKTSKVDGNVLIELDLSALSTGIYNVQLISQRGVVVKKIVKQ